MLLRESKHVNIAKVFDFGNEGDPIFSFTSQVAAR